MALKFCLILTKVTRTSQVKVKTIQLRVKPDSEPVCTFHLQKN